MIEFSNIVKMNPNSRITSKLSSCTYKIKLGSTRLINGTNLKEIEPTIYSIRSPIKITIYEYDIKEENDKPYYVKEHNKKYSLKEILNLLNDIE